VSLNELIEQVVADADYEAHRSPHRFEYAGARNVHVWGNAELLHSAIQNVVRNAIHYAADAEQIVITLSLTTSADAATLTIRDNGPGVPVEALPQLFRPFYRVDDSRVTSKGSTGLGLAITERAIALHGGHVMASNASPGLSVEISLPLLPPAVDQASRARTAS
jgi:two-component system sensor histidine kinase CpxA